MLSLRLSSGITEINEKTLFPWGVHRWVKMNNEDPMWCVIQPKYVTRQCWQRKKWLILPEMKASSQTVFFSGQGSCTARLPFPELICIPWKSQEGSYMLTILPQRKPPLEKHVVSGPPKLVGNHTNQNQKELVSLLSKAVVSGTVVLDLVGALKFFTGERTPKTNSDNDHDNKNNF